MKNQTYLRIRAACCEQHGLASGVSFRDDPEVLDRYALQVLAVVVKAKQKKKAAA